MKKYLTIALLLTMSLSVFAQDNMTVPLIEVEGYSEKKVAPDEASFQINLEEKSMKVSDGVNVLNRKTEALVNSLKKAKIKDYKLIADNYAVNVNRIYRNGSSTDSGYVARQSLQIVTSSKNEDLQKIVEAIQNSGDMSFSMNFEVSENTKKALEDQLLQEALKDAESRAMLIGQTLGIKSLRVQRVSLSADQSPYMPKMEMMRTSSSDESMAPTLFNPDEQTIQKRVYVKYTYVN
jgi:hypothetical protein